MVQASTRVVALLGDPVRHSLSPRIQNRAFQTAGVDGVYIALRCDEAEVPGLLRGIARAGGAGNVTLPHKAAAARTVDAPSARVRRTGACNTFWLDDGRIRGENTDVAGFRGAVASLLGRSAAGLRVLLIGAGGAARGALVGLEEDGAGEVLLWNRTPERARSLAKDLGITNLRVLEDRRDVGSEPLDLVVHATSLGLHADDPLPLDLEGMTRPAALLDLVYRPDETALVRSARGLGIPAADGGEMLVLQGAEAFRLWWNRTPPTEAMRDALREARGPEAGWGAAPR